MKEKMLKLCKVIRVATVAPLLAFAGLTILFFARKEVFFVDLSPQIGLKNYLFAVFFLTILPILAYPLQPLIPGFRGKGREGQRHLAILMAVLGYIGAVIYAFCANTPVGFKIVCTAYLLSGVFIAVFNKCFHIKASGHACGVVGPVAYLLYFCGWQAIFGVIPVALVFWSSLCMKRHTVPQLLTGSVLSVLPLLLSVLLLA